MPRDRGQALTASAEQPTGVRRGRRIIERPRLIKLLDEAEQQTILLLAPAGYGKTTLARQWAKTLSRVIWITLTPAHRDVVTLAEDLARGIDAQGGKASGFVDEYLRAQSNPQRAHREIGSFLATRLDGARIQWLILDDYQSVVTSSAAEALVLAVRERTSARLLIASRVRPTWASGRDLIYGENGEIGRDQLAMTPHESSQLLQSRPASESFARRAEGWPAVLALAAAATIPEPPDTSGALPGALHRYLAEELFQAASTELQRTLLTLALLGEMRQALVERDFGTPLDGLLEEARTLGFDSGEDEFEIHPLIREFLLTKLSEQPDAEKQVRCAIATSLDEENWDNALELVLRFKMLDLVEPALDRAFKPLVRAGRLGTLATYIGEVSTAPTFPPPAVEVAQAELALREGQLELARDLAQRVLPVLGRAHNLRSRTAAILGHSCFLLADFSGAETAFMEARNTARDERDQAEALHGLALANVFGERAGAAKSVAALGKRRNRSPTDLVRYATARISLCRFLDPHGLTGELHLDAPRLVLAQVEDPRARTALTYAVAGALAQKAEYQEARSWLRLFFEDATTFGLEFTMPYANWTSAQIALGLRRFGDAERALQAVEDAARRSGDVHHEVNARSLRARLLLQTSDLEQAKACVSEDIDDKLIPSWAGEYFATRSLTMACLGNATDAATASAAASKASRSHEVRLLALAAKAIVAAEDDLSPALELLDYAKRVDVWDPVVCALRSSRELADALAHESDARGVLQRLYWRISDHALARRAGLRTRAAGSPQELLSPRELEVLGLIARGHRNREISKALFIAESTTKVHVSHILEKLGVRTRAEAVARLEMFS